MSNCRKIEVTLKGKIVDADLRKFSDNILNSLDKYEPKFVSVPELDDKVLIINQFDLRNF